MGQARCLGPRSSDACSVAWKTRCRSALQAAPPTRASDNPERQMVRSSHLCRCSVSQRRPSGTWRRWAPGRVHGPQRERFLLIVLPIAWPLLAGEPRRALGAEGPPGADTAPPAAPRGAWPTLKGSLEVHCPTSWCGEPAHSAVAASSPGGVGGADCVCCIGGGGDGPASPGAALASAQAELVGVLRPRRPRATILACSRLRISRESGTRSALASSVVTKFRSCTQMSPSSQTRQPFLSRDR